MQLLNQILTSTHEFAFSKTKPFPEEPLHPLQPGGQILLKAWKNQEPEDGLTEKWAGPYDILLNTPTSKRAGVQLWVHTRIKKAPPDSDSWQDSQPSEWMTTPADLLF